MINGVKKIKEDLEKTYKIPFEVKEARLNGEPCYDMGPKNEGKNFFYIRVSFSNSIRLTAEFIPETYSADFVRSMSVKPASYREVFLKYLKLMTDRGGQVSIIIDHGKLSPEQFTTYSGPWDNLEIKATKLPVSESETFSHADKALEWGSLMMGMVLSLADIVPTGYTESAEEEGHAEGKCSQAVVKRYERNPINRKLCIERRGYICCICGMDFEKTYGAMGRHFIHVHHIIPVSQIGEGYVIDPINDLVPVCPNCHAMLHKKNPPYLPDELKAILKK